MEIFQLYITSVEKGDTFYHHQITNLIQEPIEILKRAIKLQRSGQKQDIL